MDQLQAFLPPAPGLLPKFLLLVSAISIANSIESYRNVAYSQRIYRGSNALQASPVNGLSARTFGTWTFLSSLIRLSAAYNISNPQVYQLAFATYAIAFAHFMLEWGVYESISWCKESIPPLVVSVTSMTWMLAQWSYYVR